MSQSARFERFAASMLYTIASGAKIDTDRTVPFWKQVEELYANPFERKADQPVTAEEIKAHVLKKIRELRGKRDGSSEPGSENNAG